MPAVSPLGIYIHWPFCRSKCPYCDFNSYAARGIDQYRWRRALLRELEHFSLETGHRQVGSVFFGGGTPSLMAPGTVTALIDKVHKLWLVAGELEVTLEANPSSAEATRFDAFRRAGVDRLSIGVQSFDDQVLVLLGRPHSATEGCAAIAAAREIFPRYSLDLIYAWPGQTPSHWRRELEQAAALAGEHLSAYQLTVERGTVFHRRGVSPVDEDNAAELYELTQEALATAGLTAYEISNHARPGGACQHNFNVWQGADYLGIGPGAHGRLTTSRGREAVRQRRRPWHWLAEVEERGHATARRRALTHDEHREELLLLGLRLVTGIERARFLALTGEAIESSLDPRRLEQLCAAGFVEIDDLGMRATSAGRQRLNAVIATLLG